MTKLQRLKLEGLESANFRGHKMHRFGCMPNGTQAFSTCDRCGRGLFINSKPLPNDINIGGASSCAILPDS